MNRHPIDLLSLGTGLLFSILALGYIIFPESMDLLVVVPVMLIGLGVSGIAAAIQSQRRSSET